MRSTKIIATIGPASDSDAMLDALIAGGTDIARLNFAHGTHETHAATFRRVRAAAARAGRDVAVLQDLAGPKIRTGSLRDGKPIRLRAGEHLHIVTGDDVGEPGRISTEFDVLARGVHPGNRLLLADGLIELRVDRTNGREIETTVIEGGTLGERKGINAPGVVLDAAAVTPKDVADLRFGLELGVDMIGISFVQRADDIRRARQLVTEAGTSELPIVAKLERPQALQELDEILACSDGVMVARGDLGLEMPLEHVPQMQKEITWRARRRRVPVIVATQVLESMTTEPRPTRAEVSDAANAVDDGVDAIMLAGETAAGAFPARAVQTLDAIIRDAESGVSPRPGAWDVEGEQDHAEALCEAAVTLAERGNASAIVAVTRGGGTPRRLSSLRPRVPIVATTDRADMARRLSLYWGVVPVCTEIGDTLDLGGTAIGQQLVARGLVVPGATVVLVSINPDVGRPDANYLKIQRL